MRVEGEKKGSYLVKGSTDLKGETTVRMEKNNCGFGRGSGKWLSGGKVRLQLSPSHFTLHLHPEQGAG
jgi:hypothetical protein